MPKLGKKWILLKLQDKLSREQDCWDTSNKCIWLKKIIKEINIVSLLCVPWKICKIILYFNYAPVYLCYFDIYCIINRLVFSKYYMILNLIINDLLILIHLIRELTISLLQDYEYNFFLASYYEICILS